MPASASPSTATYDGSSSAASDLQSAGAHAADGTSWFRHAGRFGLVMCSATSWPCLSRARLYLRRLWLGRSRLSDEEAGSQPHPGSDALGSRHRPAWRGM